VCLASPTPSFAPSRTVGPLRNGAVFAPRGPWPPGL
jgi:hypothetical protein